MQVTVRLTLLKGMMFAALMLPAIIFRAPWFVFWPWMVVCSILASKLIPENAP